MATVTTYATLSSPEGNKVLIVGITGSSNYNRVTGDPITAATVGGVNAIVSIAPTGANGYLPMWSNAENALFYFGSQNIAGSGANNGQPLLGVGNTVNFALITFPAIVIGTPQ